MRKSHRIWIIVSAVLLASCVADKVDYAGNSQIYGSLLYQDLATGAVRLVPAGAAVQALYVGDGNAPAQAFKTSEAGKFSFRPQVEGTYALRFTFEDTLQQYRAALVEKQDRDTARVDAGKRIRYTGEIPSVKVEGNNKFYAQEVILQATAQTGLKLIVTDEQKNPLRDVRVCLYANKAFADQNAPYCGGSLAYLSTNESGEVFFAGLEPKAYYVNARGTIGAVRVNNKWSEEMGVTVSLVAGQVVSDTVVLK
ncbi:MAG: hypothetical protein LPK14_07775 [Hymenobacteraceae bacterium]|nr:hypothetical protein [Hymenobacteraceae bacterium]